MLPISAETFPTSPDALAKALTRGLGKYSVPSGCARASGSELDAIDALEIDLTGARLTREFRLPTATATAAPSMRVQQLTVGGSPLHFEETPLAFQLEATGAALSFTGEPRNGALALTSAVEGSLSLRAERTDLEAMVQRLATQAAGKQGIDLSKTRLRLESVGPRALTFHAEVTAKVFMMSATVSLSGKLEVDDELRARLTGLRLGGDGMITKLARGFIQPQLDQLEGRAISLCALAPGSLKLRDLELRAGETLEIRARFGG